MSEHKLVSVESGKLSQGSGSSKFEITVWLADELLILRICNLKKLLNDSLLNVAIRIGLLYRDFTLFGSDLIRFS